MTFHLYQLERLMAQQSGLRCTQSQSFSLCLDLSHSASIFLALSQSFSLCLNLSRSCSAVTLDLSCVAGWYLGKIIAYDAPSSKHTISWLQDDDKDSLVDLMACKMCTEWRFVQSDEDIVAQMKELNGDDGDNGALTVVWHSD